MILKRNGWRAVCVPLAALYLALIGCSGKAGDDLMAKVNSYKIQRAELDKAYNRQVAGKSAKPTGAEEQSLRFQILEQLIVVQLYLQKAQKLGIAADDAQVDTKLKELKSPFSQEQFNKKLQEQGLTEDELKQEIRRQLTIEKLMDKEVTSRLTISDADMQNFYNHHQAQFNVAEPQFSLAHIYVSSLPNAPSGAIPNKAQNDEQAHQKIQAAYKRLQSGEDFSGLASQYSEDMETASSGGVLRPVSESQLKNADAATRDAVAKLKPGDFSNVIPIVNPATQKVLGYRILKLVGRTAAGQRTLDDPSVQQLIRNQLRSQREQFLRAAYDEDLRDNAEIHNYYVEQILKGYEAKK